MSQMLRLLALRVHPPACWLGSDQNQLAYFPLLSSIYHLDLLGSKKDCVVLIILTDYFLVSMENYKFWISFSLKKIKH